jgi:hypothetical protein
MSCSSTLDGLFSINDKIQYLAVVNMFGEVIHWNTRNPASRKEKILEHLDKIAFATNSLTFENIKLMVMDKDDLRVLVINQNENVLIVGTKKDASWHDVFNMVGSLCEVNI